ASRPSRTPQACTLSLHDALPISSAWPRPARGCGGELLMPSIATGLQASLPAKYPHLGIIKVEGAIKKFTTPSGETSSFAKRATRSEEHTSELQSRENLVCRLLLE